MEALCSNWVSVRQPSPVLLAELSKPFITSLLVEEEAILGAEPTSSARDLGVNSPLSPQYASASKNPRPRSRASRTTKSQSDLKKQRGAVLVVDDVPDVTEVIGLLLKHAGYDVSTADSARDALKLARNKRYDLVISDIGMPEMNGYELATALRSLKDYISTPMIAVTGYSEYDDRGRAVNAGFNVHLTKPIEPTQLLNLMSELLA